MTGSNKPFYKGDLFGNMGCGCRCNIRAENIEMVHVFIETSGIELRNFHRVCFFKACLFRYLVLTFIGVIGQVAYIGNVLHILYMVSRMPQPAHYHVK